MTFWLNVIKESVRGKTQIDFLCRRWAIRRSGVCLLLVFFTVKQTCTGFSDSLRPASEIHLHVPLTDHHYNIKPQSC